MPTNDRAGTRPSLWAIVGRPVAAALLTTCRRRRYDPGKSLVRPGLGPYDAGGAATRGTAHSSACLPAGAGGGPFDATPVAAFCWGTELYYPERSAQHCPPYLPMCRAG